MSKKACCEIYDCKQISEIGTCELSGPDVNDGRRMEPNRCKHREFKLKYCAEDYE